MEGGAICGIQPVTGIERQEFDLRTFRQIGRLIDDKSPCLHAAFQCHGTTVASATERDKFWPCHAPPSDDLWSARIRSGRNSDGMSAIARSEEPWRPEPHAGRFRR